MSTCRNRMGQFTSCQSGLGVVHHDAMDEHAARELILYIENDGDLYRSYTTPIRKNMLKKMDKGVYDHLKAVKGWMYLVDAGAKKYVKEFGESTPWHVMFNAATREHVAEDFAHDFERNIDEYR